MSRSVIQTALDEEMREPCTPVLRGCPPIPRAYTDGERPLPCGEYQGIDVGFSADCNGIAQLFSNLFYCGDDAGSEGTFCWKFGQWRIQHQLKCSQRSAPCPKILGSELGTHGFAQVAVYVLRAYGMGLACLIQ